MSPVTPPRAGIYGRQSKDKTKSIDEQTAECETDATEQGWQIVERYSDGVSASRFGKKERPDWDRVKEDIRTGGLDVLVMWESSRGDRTPETWLGLLSTCRERGVGIRVTTHGRTYDMSNARDWRTLAEDGIDNAYESEKISVRLKRAVAAGAAAGRPHGRIIYGYERIYDPVTRAFVEQRPHPEQAPIAVEIIERLARGEAVGSVVKDLNARGIPSPRGGRWERNTVRGLALNIAYIGKRELRGETYPAVWPALVGEGTYLAAKRILTDPARTTSRPGRQRWLLSYLARCECGEYLVGVPWREKQPRRDRYVCRRYTKGCVGVVAGTLAGDEIDGLDPLIMSLVVHRLAEPDGADLAGGDDGAALSARAEAERLQEKLDEWRDSAARGETSPASLSRIEAQLTSEISAARSSELAATASTAIAGVLDGTGGRADEIARRLSSSPIEVRRSIIASLMDIRVRRAQIPGSHNFEPERVEITRKGRT